MRKRRREEEEKTKRMRELGASNKRTEGQQREKNGDAEVYRRKIQRAGGRRIEGKLEEKGLR
jgi:hypothetical protein